MLPPVSLKQLSPGRFVLGGVRTTHPHAVTQAHFILPIPGEGDRFSCRQIIHGDFVLNEVKLLLSVKRVFQKSLPGLELLLFVPLAFVGPVSQGNMTPDLTGLHLKEKGIFSSDFWFQGMFNKGRCVSGCVTPSET